jgi:hypothetical protein
VAIAEALGAALREHLGLDIDVSHRDVGEVEREAAGLRSGRGGAPPSRPG